jgi:hypothetical protein
LSPRKSSLAYSGTAGLGFPSRPEVSFAHVVEVPEVVDHDAVTINFGIGASATSGCQSRVLERADREPPRGLQRYWRVALPK